MDAELRELYQELIIDHARHPRNFALLADHTHTQEGYNPLCGDKLMLYLRVQDQVIRDISFVGEGCAISMASASLMTEQLKGKPTTEALALFAPMHQLMTTGGVTEAEQQTLGKLTVLSGVSEFPTRVKCATLAWHTLKGALSGTSDRVTTE